MEILKITNETQNFNGWKNFPADRIELYFNRPNVKRENCIDEYIDAIENAAKYHFVEFDDSYGPPRFRAYLKTDERQEKQIIVTTDFFHRTLKSCMKKMIKILEKENALIEKRDIN